MRKGLLVCFAFAMLMLLAGCGGDNAPAPEPTPTPTSTPTPSPTPLESSRFAFIRLTAPVPGAQPAAIAPGTDSIITMMNDGTQEAMVLDHAGHFSSVQLSDDGTMCVFAAPTEEGSYNDQIFVRDLTDPQSEPVQVTTGTDAYWYPQFSHDKSQILVSTSSSSLSIITRASGDVTPVSVDSGIGRVAYATFAPDGKIVFVDEICNSIHIMNADGSQLTALNNETCQGWDQDYPSVSADGSTIVFARHGDIYRMSITGANVTQLTDTANNWQPMFINDRIVFTSWRDGGPTEIYSMNPDGGDQRRLTDNAVTDYFTDD